ncbi:MAG: glucose-6-phosphate dehydrogenase [Candidatus Paceibacterota bacterium]
MNIPSHTTPTLITIFGGTGDLARTKLLPALLDLEVKGLLPDTTRIIGFSRRAYTDDDYRAFVQEIVASQGHNHEDTVIERFLTRLYYVQGDFTTPADYQALEQYLYGCDAEIGQCTNKLFYLAVPPRYYDNIFDTFTATTLPANCSDETGWTRVIVEKPFGSDLATARELDKKLAKAFREEQIFRIDHYLGKDAVQNLLTFRFANTLFENSWSAENVESVHIRMLEKGGVEGRGEFYDHVGALRDVGQNHLLQMLAFSAMENPGEFEAQALRGAREKLLRSLRVYTSAEDVAAHTRRGQYRGYRETAGVAEDSSTETYFTLRAFIDTERWRGVPFVLEAGKQMSEKRVDITVTFKEKLPCVCGESAPHEHKNVVVITLDPDHGVSMRFWVKDPGIHFTLVEKELSFAFTEDDLSAKVPDAYEKLLYDCIRGDQTLFVSTGEVEAAWAFITPILEGWQGKKAPELAEYAPGENPEEVFDTANT